MEWITGFMSGSLGVVLFVLLYHHCRNMAELESLTNMANRLKAIIRDESAAEKKGISPTPPAGE